MKSVAWVVLPVDLMKYYESPCRESHWGNPYFICTVHHRKVWSKLHLANFRRPGGYDQTEKGLIFPATLYRSGRRPNLEFINCISTGLLMGIFLLHILPNATGTFFPYDVHMTSLWRHCDVILCHLGQLRKGLEDTRYDCYPIGEFLAGLGFFIVIGFELVIITYQNKHKIPSRVWFYAKWLEI